MSVETLVIECLQRVFHNIVLIICLTGNATLIVCPSAASLFPRRNYLLRLLDHSLQGPGLLPWPQYMVAKQLLRPRAIDHRQSPQDVSHHMEELRRHQRELVGLPHLRPPHGLFLHLQRCQLQAHATARPAQPPHPSFPVRRPVLTLLALVLELPATLK